MPRSQWYAISSDKVLYPLQVNDSIHFCSCFARQVKKKIEKSLMRNLDLSLKPGSAQVLPIQVRCRGSY